jgi:hypothetical protein
MKLPHVFNARINRFRLFVLCLFSFAVNGVSQTDPALKGLKADFTFAAGIQMSNMKFKDNASSAYQFASKEQTPWKPSFTASVWVDIFKPDELQSVHFKTGLTLYDHKFHLRKDHVAGGIRYDLIIESTRLEIPALIKIPLRKSNGGFYLQGGVGFDFTIKWSDHRATYTFPSGLWLQETSDLKPKSTFATNILGGFGYELVLSTKKLLADVTYGLNPSVFEAGYGGAPGAMINALTFTVGVMF